MNKIRVNCDCGQPYSVPEGVLGKRLNCRACDETFTCVEYKPNQSGQPGQPHQRSQPKQASQSQTKACDSCGAQLPLQKIVCTSCDYNHRTKKKIKRVDPDAKADAWKAKAEKKRTKQEKADRKKAKTGKPTKKGGGVKWGVDQAALSSGIGMLVLGSAMVVLGLLAGRIMIFGVIVAFMGLLGVVRGLIGESGIW